MGNTSEPFGRSIEYFTSRTPKHKYSLDHLSNNLSFVLFSWTPAFDHVVLFPVRSILFPSCECSDNISILTLQCQMPGNYCSEPSHLLSIRI